jgi:hypothetical protein
MLSRRRLTVALAAVAFLPACFVSIDGEDVDLQEGDLEEIHVVGSNRMSHDLRQRNREGLRRLRVDMDRAQVESIMGTRAHWIGDLGWVDAPFRQSRYLDEQGHTITVFAYYTDVVRKNGLIDDEELTPVVFRDGRLIGWGRDFPLPRSG